MQPFNIPSGYDTEFGKAPVPGVLVKLDQLTFKANTFEGTNVIATNGSQLMQLLHRGHPTQN